MESESAGRGPLKRHGCRIGVWPMARRLGAWIMRVAVSGASGLIGRRLLLELRAGGHQAIALLRRPGPAPDGAVKAVWPQAAPGDWQDALREAEAVVHLAGSPIAAGRWTASRKREIVASRVQGTERLIDGLRAAGARPRAFLCASAVGYYGPCGDGPVDEGSPAGADFLGRVCVAWEGAAQGAQELGARVVSLRTGVVLAPDGGMLARLLPFFRLGMGGPVGSGRQWIPWISLDDEVAAIRWLLEQEDAKGPHNLTAPEPVTSREFAGALGRALHRPAALPLPAALVRLLFGEMGDAVLLSGQRALPGRLAAAGFEFRHREIDAALAACLGR